MCYGGSVILVTNHAQLGTGRFYDVMNWTSKNFPFDGQSFHTLTVTQNLKGMIRRETIKSVLIKAVSTNTSSFRRFTIMKSTFIR